MPKDSAGRQEKNLDLPELFRNNPVGASIMQDQLHKTDRLDRRMVYGAVRFPEYWGKSKRKAENVVKGDSGVTVEMLRAQGMRVETGMFGVFTEPFDA